MRSGGGVSNNNNNNPFETINAAATAIAAAENRPPHAAVEVKKRRWGSCWSLYWCFGSPKHRKRIGHAVLVPEPTVSRVDASAAENPPQTTSVVLPFIAPPSSPASVLQSEAPSSIQSPAGGLSLMAVSASMYSPGGPASMFAIGPYAHETQLVTPPVFSTFTTEPSTAPFTPPPESVHMTTPSSPEVPFARLLDPIHQNGEDDLRFPFSQYEFQSYQLQPGSPVSHLISPCSGISGSGTSSPFPNGDFFPGRPHFLQFGSGDAPKLLNLEKMASREWSSHQGSGTMTPDAGVATPSNSYFWRNDETVVDQDHRVSFEITEEEVVRCVEKKPVALSRAALSSLENDECVTKKEVNPREMANGHTSRVGETSNSTSERASTDGEDGQRHQKHRSITLGSAKEFNFDSVDGVNSDKPNIGPDWWAANDKALRKEVETGKNWTFFPAMQPGVS